MEVGAVKQAFNNEVIQLKKNLNQAKIQVIHKLTRKAKTLTEKSSPEHMKEKNKRKAESAVKEVLIMKKIKPRDIARFIITFKGDLNSQLNKPTVDNDKACARLLLNKSLQQKYKIIKDKFGDIPIKDLLMSRQERRKLKKEAKDAQKNKKKGGKVVHVQGDWNVENVDNSKDQGDTNYESVGDVENDDNMADEDMSDNNDDTEMRQVVNGSDGGVENGDDSDDESMEKEDSDEEEDSDDGGKEIRKIKPVKQIAAIKTPNLDSDAENSENENTSDDEEQNSYKDVKPQEILIKKQEKPVKPNTKLKPQPIITDIEDVLSKVKPKKKPYKKVKENKNKNFNEKMLNRKFKKDNDDSQQTAKIVDPFFITASGENYMSVAEPRQPDEIKEVHRQGNRQERRAAMFGRAPIRPKRDQGFRSDKFNRNESQSNFGNDRQAKFNDRNSFNNKNSNFNAKFGDRNSKFDAKNSKTNDSNNFNNSKFDERSKFNGKSKFNDRNSGFNNNSQPKEEKLHPSWEAKKKQSGILPFKGKKIVFDEN